MKNNRKIHLVNLYKWRSITALVACLLIAFLSLGSIAYGIITERSETVNAEFEWFTVDSNCLTALAAFMIIPFAVDGIRKKRFIYPKWAQLIHYASTICTTITVVFVLAFISWYDPVLAFGEENILLHIVCPIIVLISFFMVESNFELTRRDMYIGLIPFTLYAFVYFYNVVITHNWNDHYMLNTIVPFYISMPLMFIITFLIALIIRIFYNKLKIYRDKKMRIIWDKDLDSVNIKIEIYSLGVHAGLNQSKYDVSIPFDILQELSEKYNIKIFDLAKAYIKGAIDGLKEKDNNS